MESINYGDLILKRELGKGSFGEVWEATYKGNKVAVKAIIGDIQTNIAIVNEAHNLAKANHKNIIKLYGTTYHNDRSFLVMEYMAGGSLWHLLHQQKNKKYELTDSVRWLTQAAEALAYLISEIGVHRDVKPQNMLLDAEQKNLKICDFGMVRKVATFMTNKRGTAVYMAPEVFNGCKYSDKCDVYSLGISMWEVFVRKVPYSGVDVTGNADLLIEIDMKNLRPSLTDLAKSECPMNIQTLIKKRWDKEPNVRPSMQEIVDELKSTKL
ncbi:mitogen-activated protein kinase kinase kinase 7-like [Drosophila grimshawi]|uniref:mitogen-activated protein kinase kinase kinase 7-like n=1 Tax=Drosophila grimshawi TaxID=7222 RepID=UPI001C936951|nr:mitogen-activated protein kinase kinase kinase 7-like [Drosophila grimshawi]